ncbi:MAG: HAD family hydrolase [Alphaproteobacteria bacterium]|nr:HAD family hydrolase [Alphaproteobacteria bacterium]
MMLPINTASRPSATIAVFDFDKTLNRGDSLLPFLVAVAGWPKTIVAITATLSDWACAMRKESPPPEFRTFFKSGLLRKLLSGKRADELAQAKEKVRAWMKPLPTIEALHKHYALGHHIVIASGSLDTYLPDILNAIPHHAIICTNMEIKDGVLTGRMLNGNCARERKAELVAEYMKKHGPFLESWGYGNTPHDLPMLALMQNKTIV